MNLGAEMEKFRVRGTADPSGRRLLMGVRRKIGVFLVAVVAAIGLSIVAPPGSAQAATGPCSGTQIDSFFILSDSTNSNSKIAQGVLYWNESTGKNCFRLNAYGAGIGHIDSMYASIAACATTSQSSCGSAVVDDGPYHSYAGPVTISGRNKCVLIYGFVGYKSIFAYGGEGPYHCS